MRHASNCALDQLDELLIALRQLPGVKEKSRGIFYRGGKAFVHFHEDPGGLFADARVLEKFERFRVSTEKERAAFQKALRRAVAK